MTHVGVLEVLYRVLIDRNVGQDTRHVNHSNSASVIIVPMVDNREVPRSPGWEDINQSNRKGMRIPSGSPECRDSSSHRFCLDLETYIINDHYDFEFGYKRRRNETEYEVEHVPYSFYQGGPRIKPESYSGTEDWEEYQSHFEDCADLSMWDNRSKVLFLTASLKGKARTYYELRCI